MDIPSFISETPLILSIPITGTDVNDDHTPSFPDVLTRLSFSKNPSSSMSSVPSIGTLFLQVRLRIFKFSSPSRFLLKDLNEHSLSREHITRQHVAEETGIAFSLPISYGGMVKDYSANGLISKSTFMFDNDQALELEGEIDVFKIHMFSGCRFEFSSRFVERRRQQDLASLMVDMGDESSSVLLYSENISSLFTSLAERKVLPLNIELCRKFRRATLDCWCFKKMSSQKDIHVSILSLKSNKIDSASLIILEHVTTLYDYERLNNEHVELCPKLLIDVASSIEFQNDVQNVNPNAHHMTSSLSDHFRLALISCVTP